jgi:hypothetical protein
LILLKISKTQRKQCKLAKAKIFCPRLTIDKERCNERQIRKKSWLLLHKTTIQTRMSGFDEMRIKGDEKRK